MAGECGNVSPTTPTSAGSASDSARSPLSTTLIAPESTPSESVDPVTADALHRLMAARSTVPNLPVVVDLREHSRISVDGDVVAARGLARAMICQLAVLHGPQHVKIAAVVDDAAAPEWEWLKWLPHHTEASEATGNDTSMSCSHDGAHVVVLVDGGDVPGGLPADHVTLLVIGGTDGSLPAARGAAGRHCRRSRR